MTSNKIMGGLSQEIKRLNTKNRPKDLQAVSKQSSNTADASKVENTTRDSVTISTTAKVLLEENALISKLTGQLSTLPTADEEQLENVKGRIKSGYYFSPEVDDEVAESMSSAINPPAAPLVNRKDSDGNVNNTEATNLDNIRLKIQNNQYNSNEVLDAIVSGLLGE